MRYIAALCGLGGNITWQNMGMFGSATEGPGVTITFSFVAGRTSREVHHFVRQRLSSEGTEWLRFSSGRWFVDAGSMKRFFDDFHDEDWLDGTIEALAEDYSELKDRFGRLEERRYFRILLTPEFVMNQRPRRIFLSHKGSDKPLVRRVGRCLERIGLSVWLDEDAMVAGTELERGLLKGFEDSCAAVFFLTSNFLDQGFLSTEINYALSQKREKGDRFSVVTLQFRGKDGKAGTVPNLLQQYVWKQIDYEADAISEIVNAIPLKVGEGCWDWRG